MNRQEAEEKICPYINSNCITEKCMFWETTINGKKEIDRYKMPYDIYPRDEGDKHRQLIKDGYEETKNKVYIKYETAFEGFCTLKNNSIKPLN